MLPRSSTMFLAEIGTAGAISAYFFRHITSAYSLNVSDPIKGQPVQLSDYLFVFVCGLVFWLLVMLRAKLHDSGDRQADIRKVAKLAKLIAPITTINLCGCLLAPFMKLPLLVRFLLLFQVSSNPALLLIWAFLPLKERMILLYWAFLFLKDYIIFLYARPQQKQEPSPVDQAVLQQKPSPESQAKIRVVDKIGRRPTACNALEQEIKFPRYKPLAVPKIDGVGGNVDEAGGSRSGYVCGPSVSRPVPASVSALAPASTSTISTPASVSAAGGDKDKNGGRFDPESGGRETNTEQAFKSSKITVMCLMLTAQISATLTGFHTTPTPSSSSKALLVVALMDQLVAYLCGFTSILLSSNKPEDSKAAMIFADIGFVCTLLGFILMVAMLVPWYLVLIVVLLFGVIWLIFFWNELKTRATEVWNYLKNSTHAIKNCIGMLFETGS